MEETCDMLKLYHGSDVVIDKVDLSLGRINKDFGKGFYLTSLCQQAIEMGKRRAHQTLGGAPVVTEFLFDDSCLKSSELNIKIFPCVSEEWALFILNNRHSSRNGFNHNYDFSIPTPLSPIDWYALITHSCGYIGNNMHPIISALHNGVPCVSIDNYMLYEKIDCEASKIYDILKRFGLERNYITPEKLEKEIDANFVYELICTFPVDKIKSIAETRLVEYNQMMVKLLNIITK